MRSNPLRDFDAIENGITIIIKVLLILVMLPFRMGAKLYKWIKNDGPV